MDKDLIINLYKKQYKIISLYLIKCGCSVSDAEDIVHDSFIKAIEYLEGVKVNDVSSWLFRVAVNKYKNFNKRKKIINTVSINEESFYEQIAQEFTVEGEILSKEISEEIRGTLNGLKEEYRSLLILKYDMELSYKEIGLLLGINEDSVKTYLYRARNKFKEEWRKSNERYG
ncbi:MAG: RNA polymerase sigma factor [Clostridium sp.]|uniref:RNA polymerase sigma factor n=1 Tax=Clostridium culturomicium TaxID=1499683 RepID=UPI00058D1EAC|nr:RNA polymerase sigma factor [Clostridium culturomicium]MDU4888977.1 RNA polymerase sigma factor [Clostridium sp.]MDU7083379.1 RNA polymerase sigma factor [Clostridium sp.]